jgi:quinoprotein glucose dehydrogenase/quinate dehydrogenase (quinone)
MWGATPFDQLWCRIAFRSNRYDGQFTPQSVRGSIVYPGSFGVFNWGSVAVDPERRVMIVNTSFLPYRDRLIPRSEADALGVVAHGVRANIRTANAQQASKARRVLAQSGTPYAVELGPFLSPLGFPCNQPPWGEIAAIDLDSYRVLWRRPLGTTRDNAPLGMPLPVGVFNLGGSVTTRGGVVFIGATIDNYLRAYDTTTGKLLWRARLPAGGQSNPISFVSKRSGRQFIVMIAGGNSIMGTTLGDYVLAYALAQ